MIWVIALTIWITVLVGARLTMSRDLLRCVLGLSIFGSAVNLVLFSSGRVASPQPAIVVDGATTLGESANPIPQALVLTAIVIGFALICFALVLVLRLVRESGSDSALDLRFTEPVATHAYEPPASHPAHEPTHPDSAMAANRGGSRTVAGGEHHA